LSFPHNRWENEFSFKTASSYEDIVTIAPINLPDGVIARKLAAYITDNTPEDEARILIILGRQNLQTGSREQMIYFLWSLKIFRGLPFPQIIALYLARTEKLEGRQPMIFLISRGSAYRFPS